MKTKKIVCMVVALASVATLGAKVPPKPQDFAYGMTLEIDEKHPLHELTLPVAIYKGVTRADLGDMRVFNGQGLVAPHAVRRPQAHTREAEFADVPRFPIYSKSGEFIGGLSLRLQRNQEGSILDVKLDDKDEPKTKLVAYVLDTSRIDQPIHSLKLDWRQPDSGFIGKVDVASSDDLEHWASVANGASVASLRYAGHNLERRVVVIGNIKAKYLRLTWPESQEALSISRVTAELWPRETTFERSWANVRGKQHDKEPGEYLFDAGGNIPVDRTRVLIEGRNVVVRVNIFSRAEPDSEWHHRTSGLVYNLELEGEKFTQPDFTFARTADRYWRLRVEQSEEHLGVAVPVLELGWVPQRLVFVSRGQGPYQIAYGSASIRPTGFEVEGLLGTFDDAANTKLDTRVAQPGIGRALGGEAKLKPLAEVPWKRWILWSVLVLGVGILAWMALRLFRQLDAANSEM